MSTSSSTRQPGEGYELWSIRGLIAKHKVASLVVAAVCVFTVAIFAMTALGAKAGAVTDRTTCDQWGSTNVNGQNAYARLYISEHGPVSSRWGPGTVGVINAINAGCYQAFGEDVDNTATVVQAISRTF
jgi:hypothetical protein